MALRQGDVVIAAVSFDYDEAGKACRINVMRNPDKLAALGRATRT